MAEWHFITNHGAVLVLIMQRGQITAGGGDLGADRARRIIAELEGAGYLKSGEGG